MSTSGCPNTLVTYKYGSVFEYRVINGKAIITGLQRGAGTINKSQKLIIPPQFMGVPVNAVEAGAFTDTDGITSIEMNYPLDYISDNAFANNTTVQEIKITAAGVIGNNAFTGASALKTVIINSSGPLGESLFAGCPALESVNIVQAENLGSNAFKGSGVKSVMLGTIGDIGESAFENCTQLESVVITKAGNLGNHVFRNSGIIGVKLETVGGIGEAVFEDTARLERVNITKAERLGNSAFKNSGIKSLEAETIGEIGDSVFESCRRLERVSIDTVKNIGDNFARNSSINAVSFGTVSRIGDYAFYGCKNLGPNIRFGNATPPTLGTGAFENVAPDFKITVPEGTIANFANEPGFSSYATKLVDDKGAAAKKDKAISAIQFFGANYLQLEGGIPANPGPDGIIEIRAKTLQGTKINELVSYISHTGESINPPNFSILDFTIGNSKIFTVTAQDKTTQQYRITLTNDLRGKLISYFTNVNENKSIDFFVTDEMNPHKVKDFNDGELFNTYTQPSTYVTPAFKGWSTTPDGSGTEYAVGANVTETVQLYAQWNDIKFDETYYNTNAVFTVKIKEQLNGIAVLADSGKDFSGKTVVLVSDLNMNEGGSYGYAARTFQGIATGSAAKTFRGIFEGNSHSVTFSIDKSDSDYQGFIGNLAKGINKAEVKNLKISAESSITGRSRVGSIAGSMAESSVFNCQNNAVVSGVQYVGGLVGYSAGTSSLTGTAASKIINTGAVTVSGTSETYAGGITGYASGTVTIMHAENNAAVQGGGNRVGGILGYVAGGGEAIIENAINTKSVSGRQLIGGIVGDSESKVTIKTVTNSGSIAGNSSYIGGIAGRIAGNNSSEISSAINNPASVTGGIYLGGIAGYAEGTAFADCVNSVALTSSSYIGGIAGYISSSSISGSKNTQAVSGVQYVGGLVGYASGTSSLTGTDSAKNINEGAVTGTYTGDTNAGGIVGYAGGPITIVSAENKGALASSGNRAGGIVGSASGVAVIRACTNSGSISGKQWVGGLVGSAGAGSTIGGDNSGNVTGSSNDVGGIIGILGAENVTTRSVILTGTSNSGNVTTPGCSVGGIAGTVHYTDIGPVTNKGKTDGSYNIGGIVGYTKTTTTLIGTNDKKITNTGTVTGKFTGNAQTGGIVGEGKNLTIKYAENNATSNPGVESKGNRAGGILGYAVSSVTIENCINNAKVKAAGNDAGGIVSSSSEITIRNCSNTAEISAGKENAGGIAGWIQTNSLIENSSNSESIKGLLNVGGIAGYVKGSSTAKTIISMTWNSGSIESINSDNDKNYNGGIASVIEDNVLIERCYNKGIIKMCHRSGGLVGSARGSIQSRIDSSYNIGTVNGGGYIGGLVGQLACPLEIQNCYSIGVIRASYNGGGIVGALEPQGRLTVTQTSVYRNSPGSAVGYNAPGGQISNPAGLQAKSADWFNSASGSQAVFQSFGWTFNNEYWEYQTGLTLINDVQRRPVLSRVGGSLSNK